MCQLQEIHYGCGHSRKVLLHPCDTAMKLGPTPKRAPSFCLEGLQVVHTIQSPGDCGRGMDGFTCREIQTLKPLEKRYAEMKKELDSFNKRASHIRDVLKLGVEPDCNWEHSESKMAIVREEYEKVFGELLPMNLMEWTRVVTYSEDQLEIAFNITSATLLSKASGKAVTSSCKLNPYLAEQDVYIPKPENPEMQLIEETWEKLRARAHGVIETLEEMAVRACLDDVGWQLPDDEADRYALTVAILWRVVQPRKGPEVKTFRDSEPASYPVSQTEIDPLDTAEDFDPWMKQ